MPKIWRKKMFLHYRRILKTFFFFSKQIWKYQYRYLDWWMQNVNAFLALCSKSSISLQYRPKTLEFFITIELVLNDLIKLKKISYQYLVFLSLECNIPLQEDYWIWLVYITTIAYLLDYSPWMDIYFNYLVPFLVWSYNQRS